MNNQNLSRLAVIVSLVGLLWLGAVAQAAPGVPVGGGVMDAGWEAEYFSNPNLKGEPAFVRKEVRLRFDWGQVLPVGGSNAARYRTFPHDNFSARWTGKLLPRFSEPYTLHLTFDEGARVFIRTASVGAWQTVLDSWAKSGDLKSKPLPMETGKPYEVRVEYRNLTGAANCILQWSSPSTPEETVETVAQNGLNLASWSGYFSADQGRSGRYWRINGQDPKAIPQLLDEQGWPKTDADFIPFEASQNVRGTYLVSFNGKADLNMRLMRASFEVDGKKYGARLPSGVGYDSKTNMTTAKMVMESDEGTGFLNFTNTSRDGSATTGTGFTNLKIMRPIEHESETPHDVSERNYLPLEHMAEAFTVVRWLEVANGNAITEWGKRTPPDYRAMTKPSDKGESKPGENWESLIEFANETGRDLYICTPVAANDEYFAKLAKLLRYGSDGMEPYDGLTANPKYAPLNSNLTCYVEVGNEIWNWAFASTQQAVDSANSEAKANSPLWKIVNYDGKVANPGYADGIRRWQAARTVAMSRAFRSVFGDGGFGNRFRPLMEFQYANAQGTAASSFDFLDGYYNNGAGGFVPDPKPVPYYVWGGGGAAYYGVGNGDGNQEETVIPDAGFETAAVSEAQAPVQSADAPWKFAGKAGVYRPLNSAVPNYKSSEKFKVNSKMAYGFRFRVGDKPIYVQQLGQVFSGASDGATLRILKADDKTEVAKGNTGKIMAYLVKIFGYYTTKKFETPVRLEPNTEYLLMGNIDGGSVASDDAPVANVGPGLTLLGSVKAKADDLEAPASWQFSDGKAGSVFGPMTLLYSFSPDAKSDLPQPPDGQQGAAIFGQGSMSTTVNFAKVGKYALTFNATGKNDFQIQLDDQSANAMSQQDYRTAEDPASANALGGWGRNNGFKEEWGSGVFTVDKPGPHVITFRGLGKDDQIVVLDDIEVKSVDAILSSGFGSGSALGQPAENKWSDSQRTDSTFPSSFGLPRVSYETGWSLGGDFYQKPIQNFVKFKDPRTKSINDTVIKIFQGSGGFLPVWGVYNYWPNNDFKGGPDYPIMQSFIAASNQLPVEADNGVALPATLNADNAVKWNSKPSPNLETRGSYLAWTVVAPKTGDYSVHVNAAGDGLADVAVDGLSLGQPFSVATAPEFKVHLTQGMHGLRVRNMGEKIAVKNLEFQISN